MLFAHYSNREMTLDYDRSYGFPAGEKLSVYSKPKGLWLSDDSDFGWAEWCRSEEFRLETLRYRYDVELHENANILSLTTPEEIRKLGYRYPAPLDSLARRCIPGEAIDWKKIAEEYQGISITPYQWSVRIEVPWYYPWDCASACIWDLSAVKSFTLAEDSREVSV